RIKSTAHIVTLTFPAPLPTMLTGPAMAPGRHGSSHQPHKERLMHTHTHHPSAARRCVQLLLCTLLLPLAALAGPVDINTADAASIAPELVGIGLAKAEAIVAYRERHGAFKSLDELRKVKGIGARTLELNRANIRIKTTPQRPAQAQ